MKPGGVAILRDNGRYIYYLITKLSSWGKPTYELLHSSLSAMQQHMVRALLAYIQYNSFRLQQAAHNVTKLALPRIGCGLDGLRWSKVREMLAEIFQSNSIELKVYNYAPPSNK